MREEGGEARGENLDIPKQDYILGSKYLAASFFPVRYLKKL
jgi:hypothetical protein